MNRIANILLYAGLEREDFKVCKAYIDEDNRKRLFSFLLISIVFLFVMHCLSDEMPDLAHNQGAYHLALLISSILLAVERTFKNRRGVFQFWLIYAFEAEMYGLGIALAVMSPEQPSVSFVAFLLAVPLMFTLRPIQHITNIMFHGTIFIFLAFWLESGHTRNLDIVNAVSFALVSGVISSYMMVSVCRDFSSSRQLRQIAIYDLLTGMQNRNAYEKGRDQWKERCSVSLSCIYVDVNGLHGRNNTMGHESGDQMLQTVAQEMREIFGHKNCYRIGGDEFLAFEPDSATPTVIHQAEKLRQNLLRSGYSVSVGVAWQSVRELDMDSLIKLAEKRMYTEKQDYYRNLSCADAERI